MKTPRNNLSGCCLLVLLLLFAECSLFANVVNVFEIADYDGVTETLSERQLETGILYYTMKPPAKEGLIFTRWEMTNQQEFVSHDYWGRAYEENPYLLYEDTMLVAHYLSASRDDDSDGIPDGFELYWYGNLDKSGDDDSDDDGIPFAKELEQGTNPLMPDGAERSIMFADSNSLTYNPNSYGTITICSVPEGLLFDTVTDILHPGSLISTATVGVCDPVDSKFAYWSVNGIRLADTWGRAIETVEFIADGKPARIVAVAANDYVERMKLYWYGTTDVDMSSDTDGDGKSFQEELDQGTNPLMPDKVGVGFVKYTDSDVVQYNPFSWAQVTFRSNPENYLFETFTEMYRQGEEISTTTAGHFDTINSYFAFWSIDGIRQADPWGRAVDDVTVVADGRPHELIAVAEEDYERRMKLYWYGSTDVEMKSDTDGDGISFADELLACTNPLMANETITGKIRWADSVPLEANLQHYEQLQGVLVDGNYVQMFTSPMAGNTATSITFFKGAAVKPIVADLNGDGLFDIVVVRIADGKCIAFLNCGSMGNPEFRTVEWNDGWGAIVEQSELKTWAELSLDVEPVASLSQTLAGDDLLVSDEAGRIWFYKAQGEEMILQHKVWGGTFAGFACGLRIAAVDWEADGDWDCLCGTAEGKLMLLRDPKIGRPTNLRARTGVDNVLLEWDPNQQSRVRGYKVYRNATKSGDDGDVVGEPNLPRYRDWPPVIKDYEYRVSAFGRFYTAGNSEPEIVESPLTDPVQVELGKVSLSWNDATAFAGDEVGASLSIENSLSLSGSGLVLKVEYDSKVLTPVRIQKSGLTEGIVLNDTVADGQWSICSAGGEMAAGGGTMLTMVFKTSDFVVGTNTTSVGLSFASLKTVGGADISIAMPLSEADVLIVPSHNPSGDPTVVPPYSRGDVNGDGRLTKADLQLMANLMKGGPNEKWNSNQLDAGDYNDNDSLDQDDYKLMRDDFRAKCIVNGGDKMGVL